MVTVLAPNTTHSLMSCRRQNVVSKHYDYKLIYDRLQCIIEAIDDDDILTLVNLLRSGLVRNLGNITAPRLFNRAYAGTKLLIEDYVTQVAFAIDHVTNYPTTFSFDSGLTSQAKLDLLHDTRQAFGRSALLLQGGSIFGLCHIGVVKALHLRGVLPRIIVGTATGALIAALVGVHDGEELLHFLSGEGIDLRAFTERSKVAASSAKASHVTHGWFSTFMRRVNRFVRDGYLLDAQALEECIKANVGDLTFAEAYQKTKRVLNITVLSTSSGVPNLLNYLTAPNVLVWSAALISNLPDAGTSILRLQCKDDVGNIVAWSSAQETTFHPWTHTKYTTERETPLTRTAELFNVNHFIVSQARPYIAPFLRSDLGRTKPRYASRTSVKAGVLKVIFMELQHRLYQLDSLGYLPARTRRFLLDDSIPGPSLTLVPDVTFSDYLKLLENPTKDSIDYWILKGERSVWPAIGALKIRSAIEVELDRGYQMVRRRKPFDLVPLPFGQAGIHTNTAAIANNRVKKRKRSRAASMSAS